MNFTFTDDSGKEQVTYVTCYSKHDNFYSDNDYEDVSSYTSMMLKNTFTSDPSEHVSIGSGMSSMSSPTKWEKIRHFINIPDNVKYFINANEMEAFNIFIEKFNRDMETAGYIYIKLNDGEKRYYVLPYGRTNEFFMRRLTELCEDLVMDQNIDTYMILPHGIENWAEHKPEYTDYLQYREFKILMASLVLGI